MADKTTLDRLAAPWLPTEPQFDLTAEPWVDVTAPDGSGPATMSLRDVLAQAHAVVLDDARHGSLLVHGLRRFLIALTHIAYAHAPDHAWNAVADAAEPLPAAAFDAVLARLRHHLWLHHPDTPFMQRPAVLTAMSASTHKDPATALVNATHPYWTLRPDIPSKSNVAWFNRHGDLAPPTPADAANALLLRHYFALPGNEAANRVAGTKTSKGGPTALTNFGRSFVTRTGATLAQTLASNLLDSWIDMVTATTPTFWEQPDAVPANRGNPLWDYTASGAATVLMQVPTDIDPAGYRVVRTPAPIGKEHARHLKEAMQAGDPHTLKIDPSSEATSRSYVVFQTDGNDLELARRFHGKVRDRAALHEPCVIRGRATRYGRGNPVECLNIAGSGTSTGPSIAGTSAVTSRADHLLVEPTVAECFVELADRIVYAKGSVGSRVVSALARVASGERDDGSRAHPPKWVYLHVQSNLAAAVDGVLRRLLDACVAAPTPAAMPENLIDKDRATVIQAGLDVFDQTCPRLGAGPAHSARTIQERIRLESILKGML